MPIYYGSQPVSSVYRNGVQYNPDGGPAAPVEDTTPPVITGSATPSIVEGNTTVGTYTANETVAWSLTGVDAALFSITGGNLAFLSAPSFSAPSDAGANNVYDVNVVATDTASNVSTLAVAITVTAVAANPTIPSGADVHVDADSLVLAQGATLSGTNWVDSVGARNVVVSSGSPTYDDGTNSRAGLPNVYFDGSIANRLKFEDVSTFAEGSDTWVIVAECELPSTANDGRFMFNRDSVDGPANPAIVVNHSSWSHMRFGSVGRSSLEAPKIVPDAFMSPNIVVHTVTYDSATRTYSYYLNGEFTGSTVLTADRSAGGIVYLGNHPTSDVAFAGRFYEIIRYPRALSAAEVLELEEYRQFRYGEKMQYESELTAFAGAQTVSIWKEGTTLYNFYVEPTGVDVHYATAPVGDPDNWTLQGAVLTGLAYTTRGLGVAKDGATWYILTDDRDTGVIRGYSGTSLAAMTAQGTVISGDGVPGSNGQFLRHPFIVTPANSHDNAWHLLLDGRATSATSGFGSLIAVDGTDPLTWTSGSRREILAPSGNPDLGDNTDVGGPSAYWDGARYIVAFAGFNQDFRGIETGVMATHFFGLATGVDLTSALTKVTDSAIPFKHGETGSADDYTNAGVVQPDLYFDGTSLFCYGVGHVDQNSVQANHGFTTFKALVDTSMF